MTYLEFLSLLALYMAWVVLLLLRLIMADESLPQESNEPWEIGGR